jgi:hypothetical protein
LFSRIPGKLKRAEPLEQLYNIIHNSCLELEGLGHDCAMLGHGRDNEALVIHGVQMAHDYFKQDHVQREFLNYLNKSGMNHHKPCANIDELRKEVQSLMNGLYSHLMKQPSTMRYSDVKSGRLILDGFPAALSILLHSYYRMEQLEAILDARNDITLSYGEQHAELSSRALAISAGL